MAVVRYNDGFCGFTPTRLRARQTASRLAASALAIERLRPLKLHRSRVRGCPKTLVILGLMRLNFSFSVRIRLFSHAISPPSG